MGFQHPKVQSPLAQAVSKAQQIIPQIIHNYVDGVACLGHTLPRLAPQPCLKIKGILFFCYFIDQKISWRVKVPAISFISRLKFIQQILKDLFFCTYRTRIFLDLSLQMLPTDC